MFLEELDQPVIDTGTEVWDLFWRRYCDRRNGLFLCPIASRYEVNTNDPLWMDRAAIDCGLGSRFTAWKLVSRTPTTLEPGPLFGSYGYNGSGPTFLDKRIRGGRRYTSSNVPVFLDSVDVYVQANAGDDPPAYDGQSTCPGDMKRVCIDRHEGTINSLFLDWSVRKVGLKELWTLDWSPFFDRQNRWTRAGGVQPTDWPQWMRGFRDY